jgi:2-polyprenyl-6-methoxyphenol hydroxylase-like FAD-dependent oxidoreductase
VAPRRVAIVGAGIGGLTAAIALTRAGFDVAVYEQAAELGEVGAGMGLWPNALRVLARLGLGEDVLSLAGGGVGIGLRRADGRWLMRQSAQEMQNRWAAPFACVHRAELHALLVKRLDPTTVHLGARCSGFEQRDGIVALRFEGRGDHVDVQADVLVGADGVHSVVRAELSGPARLRYRGYTNWRGTTAPGSVPPVADSTDSWGRGGHFGLQPTSGGRILWYAGLNAGEAVADDEQTRARLLEAFGAWHAPIGAVIEATPDAALIRTDIYDARPSRRWSRGAVTLVGDAIHPMTPDLGQGACQAIVDAAVLAQCLTETGDVHAALTAYRRRRAWTATLATLFSRYWGAAAQRDGRLACTLRDAMLAATPRALQLRQLDLLVERP